MLRFETGCDIDDGSGFVIRKPVKGRIPAHSPSAYEAFILKVGTGITAIERGDTSALIWAG